LGRAYSVTAVELPPARGDGAPASSLVDVQGGAKIMYCLAGKPDTGVLVASTGGYGFLTRLSDMISNRKAGREFMTLEEGEIPVAPMVYAEAPGNLIAAVSQNGRLLVFELGEMRQVARGRGVIIMGLEEREKLLAAAVFGGKSLCISGQGRGGKQKELVLSGEKLKHYFGRRARMGRVLPDKLKPAALQIPATRGESA
jgi:topoisomerase IV subunit A